jgi:pSer/pThr/pTyr-binding forkhead associated (FHA) protein
LLIAPDIFLHDSLTPRLALSAASTQPVTLQLLATAHGQPLQSWEFTDRPLIQIGRAPDCDVVIASPVVSRSHAYLKHTPGGWELGVVSQNGVFVDGTRVPELRLCEGTVFRLAATGPFVRFGRMQDETMQLRQTVLPGESGVMPLLIDEDKRDRQVDEIADGPYFQHLQHLARQMRNKSG